MLTADGRSALGRQACGHEKERAIFRGAAARRVNAQHIARRLPDCMNAFLYVYRSGHMVSLSAYGKAGTGRYCPGFAADDHLSPLTGS